MNATTADELLDYYENTFHKMEMEFYDAIREYFVNKLAEYDADDPFGCDIEVETDYELGYTPKPCIIAAWYASDTEGIYFQEDLLGDYAKELCEYSIFELMSIVNGFKEYFGE